MLGLAGLQCGLLSELSGFFGGGRAAVSLLEAGREHRAPQLDLVAALGPVPRQVSVDAGDFADRVLALVAASGGLAVGEGDAESLGEQSLEAGVVALGCRDVVLVDGAAIEGEPGAVEGLDLVADRDVGVQVGVAGA